jgi:hypothetical protein
VKDALTEKHAADYLLGHANTILFPDDKKETYVRLSAGKNEE